jgi:hypothetical protein
MFAVRCARRALERLPSPDPRSVAAVDAAERHAQGMATDEELAQARLPAGAVAYAAYAADDAAGAYAAAAGAYAAFAVAYAAADAAARAADAAFAVAYAADGGQQLADFLELVS